MAGLEQSDREKELASLESFLRQPDSVLEANLITVVGRYLNTGGKASEVIEYLSESYSGYGQMASLASKWLTEYTSGQPAASASMPPEVYYLQQMVKDHFDPKRLDALFVRGPPAWIERLIQHHSGRQLIYDLSAKHHNCLLLNYAIQKILQQGYEAEVAAMGSALASYFGIFHRLLVARLKAALTATTEQLSTISQELKGSCVHSLHTYLHVQMLLTELSREVGGTVYRRLSEDLQEQVAKEHPAAWKLQHVLLPRGASDAAWEAAQLLEALLPSTAPLPPAAQPQLLRLHALITAAPADAADAAAPTSVLQHPRLLRLLLETLFTPSPAQPGEVVEACIQLLAVAASEEHSGAGAGPGSEADEDATKEPLEEQAAAAGTLRMAQHLCSSAVAGASISGEDLDASQQVFDTPLSALGVLHSSRCLLTARETYSDALAGSQLAAYRLMLHRLAAAQPAMGAKVVEIAGAALSLLGPLHTDLARIVLDMLAQQLLLGHHVELVLQCVEKWSAEGDPAAIRGFILTVLRLCAPPYSAAFASGLLRLVPAAAFRRSRDCPPGTQLGQLLDEFLHACPSNSLSASERAALQDLASR